MNGQQYTLADTINRIRRQKDKWLLSGDYKVLREMPHRAFIESMDKTTVEIPQDMQKHFYREEVAECQ